MAQPLACSQISLSDLLASPKRSIELFHSVETIALIFFSSFIPKMAWPVQMAAALVSIGGGGVPRAGEDAGVSGQLAHGIRYDGLCRPRLTGFGRLVRLVGPVGNARRLLFDAAGESSVVAVPAASLTCILTALGLAPCNPLRDEFPGGADEFGVALSGSASDLPEDKANGRGGRTADTEPA